MKDKIMKLPSSITILDFSDSSSTLLTHCLVVGPFQYLYYLSNMLFASSF